MSNSNAAAERRARVTTFDLLLQQTINGLSLGAMYALLALGFTLVYGIIELINFSHFSVFMVGSFVAMWTLQALGFRARPSFSPACPLPACCSWLFWPRWSRPACSAF